MDLPRVIYMAGIWDSPFKVASLRFLTYAAKFGDLLIVGVLGDALVERKWGKLPLFNQADRLYVVNSLKCVGEALSLDSFDVTKNLVLLADRPYSSVSIILGNDQNYLDVSYADSKKYSIIRLPNRADLV